MVLNVLNVFEIFKCIDYLRNIGAHDNSFMILHAYTPKWTDIRNLPKDLLNQFINSCEKYMSDTKSEYWLYHALEGCINYVRTPFKKNIKETIRNLEMLDIRRNLNSKKHFAYIYD